MSILKERIHRWWCYYVCLFGLVPLWAWPLVWGHSHGHCGQEPAQYLPQFSCPWPSPGQAWEWEHKGNWQLRHGKLGQRRKKQSPDTFKKGLHFVNTGPPVVASFRAGPFVAALVVSPQLNGSQLFLQIDHGLTLQWTKNILKLTIWETKKNVHLCQLYHVFLQMFGSHFIIILGAQAILAMYEIRMQSEKRNNAFQGHVNS